MFRTRPSNFRTPTPHLSQPTYGSAHPSRHHSTHQRVSHVCNTAEIQRQYSGECGNCNPFVLRSASPVALSSSVPSPSSPFSVTHIIPALNSFQNHVRLHDKALGLGSEATLSGPDSGSCGVCGLWPKSPSDSHTAARTVQSPIKP